MMPPSTPCVLTAKYSIGVGPRPTRSTSMPPANNPSISAPSSSGELTRPSRPTATRLPPASSTTAAKARPRARALAGDKVSPTMPRTSYSRKIVGLKAWARAPSCMGLLPSLAIFIEYAARDLGHVRPLQREGDIRLQEAGLVAAIEATAVEAEAMEGLVAA